MTTWLNRFEQWLRGAPDLRFTLQNWRLDDAHLYLDLVDKTPANVQALAMEQQGSLEVEGQVLFNAKEKPEWFHHGTDCKTALAVLQEGLKSSSQLNLPPHRPDGVYSYSDVNLSSNSMYNAGAIIHFNGIGVVLPVTAKLDKVPLGGICRCSRSASKKLGAIGQEWIHHPDGCVVRRMTLKLATLQVEVQAHTTNISFEIVYFSAVLII